MLSENNNDKNNTNKNNISKTNKNININNNKIIIKIIRKKNWRAAGLELTNQKAANITAVCYS